MSTRPTVSWLRTLACLSATLLGITAWANDSRASRVPPLPEYTQECASCHLAFPPGLLPAPSWRRVADNLARHYGTDASIDPALPRSLSAWLEANAGSGTRACEQPTEGRITRSAWFQREHDEVSAAT